MAKLSTVIGGAFDSNAVDPADSRDFSPLPAGLYTVEITNADIKDLKSGNGTGLSVEFTVIDPEQYARRKVFANLNIRHTNSQAEQIAQSQLSALCRAVGIGVLDDTDALFQKILKVRVKIRAASGGYPESNDITGYEPAGAMPPAVSPQRSAAPAPAAAGGASRKPWQKAA
jgi:hypothetical protein